MQYQNYKPRQPFVAQTVQQQSVPQGEKQRYKEHPDFKSTIRISKDGRYVIHKLTITTFKPVSFLTSEVRREE